jgi:carboxypeptidase PM20D1
MPDTVLTILIVLLVLILFAAALMIFRAMMFGRVPEEVEPVEVMPVEGALVAEHLAAAVSIPSISTGDSSTFDGQAFNALHTALERMYPRVHGSLTMETINTYSLLFTWPGRAPELEPVLLCGHLDVVPADPATREAWTYPPFSGEVADGQVWGRGTLDMKGTVITILEAVEGLLKTGYQPERTLYLGFGHDEEIGGMNGARCISELLTERGVRLAAVFDEGGAIMEGMVPGVDLPVALVAVAEKGFASLELKVEGRPGHSAMPPPHTAIGVLARAITRIEAEPMPANLKMIQMMFNNLGIFLPFKLRLAFANIGLLRGLIVKQMASSPTNNSMMRTTTAATIIEGGVKDNILPAQARAVVNCRILPGDTREKLVTHVRKVINDEAVQVFLAADRSWEPSVISPTDSPVFTNLVRTIRQVYPEVVVAPFLVSGATDSRHYLPLTENVYRFSPYFLNADLLKTVHGIDERVPVATLERMVQFYGQLIKSWTTIVGTGS